jgi:tetratricopeptide (TPR) repeat protein
MDPAQGRWLLERIADVHLVEEFGFGRYRMHDLIRTFAAEQDTGSDGDQALRRLMSFYVGAVTHATATATANEIVTPEQPEPAVALPALSDPHAAMAWLDGELPNIAAVVRFAAEHGPPEPAWQISRRLTHYFWIRRTLPEWRAINEAALAAARAADRPDVVAPMLNALAVTIWTTNDLDRTRSLLEEALALNLRSGREAAQASNHTNLGSLCRQTGQLGAAFAHTRTAVRLGRRHDRPLTVANALLNLACLYHDLGALYEASRTVDRALTTYRTLGSTDGQITSLNVLAEIRCELGHHRAAQSAAEQSLEMADTFGSVHGSIFARQAMTDLLIATGRPEASRAQRGGAGQRRRARRPPPDHHRDPAAGGRAGRSELRRQGPARGRTDPAPGPRAARPARLRRRPADHGAASRGAAAGPVPRAYRRTCGCAGRLAAARGQGSAGQGRTVGRRAGSDERAVGRGTGMAGLAPFGC